MNSSCTFYTTESGMLCPLCRVEVQPCVTHYCSKDDPPVKPKAPPKPKAKKRAVIDLSEGDRI